MCGAVGTAPREKTTNGRQLDELVCFLFSHFRIRHKTGYFALRTLNNGVA